MKNIEAQIRDRLASNLAIIDTDLELIGTEHYIPEAKTTKSFIDILAKNKRNDYIIIEIKRSSQSSRQAIHEIYKYTEAIKERYKVTEGEIQAYIISTEWKELYIPFSAFVNESNISLKGIKIEVDKDFNILSTQIIEPFETNKGRLFSRIQDCNLYLDEENLEKGIKSHKEVFSKKRFTNYVLVILKGANFNVDKYKKDMTSILADILEQEPEEIKQEFDQMPIHKYMIYSAFQRQTKEEYYEILKQDLNQYKETTEYLEYEKFDDEDDILSTLEGSILGDLKPWFYCDTSEIGYPAKFGSKILDDEKWEIQKIIRSDAFLKNELLTDEKIISEMRGNTGVSNVTLKDTCSIQHKAKYNEIKNYANEALKYNTVWLNHIKIFFAEIDDYLNYNLEIKIFNTSHIILSLMHIVAKQNLEGYAPNYFLQVNKENQKKTYFGTFHWNKTYPNFNEIIKKYYNDQPGNLLMTMVWGGFESKNDDILEDLGLSFQSYLLDEKEGSSELYLYKNFKFRKVENIQNGLVDFIEGNLEFMSNLEHIYKTNHHQAKLHF